MGLKTKIACTLISLPFLTAAGCMARIGYDRANEIEGLRQQTFDACKGVGEYDRKNHPSGDYQAALCYSARAFACSAAVGAYFASDLKVP
jgi:hypothetical protein